MPGGRGSSRRAHCQDRVVDEQSAARRGEGLSARYFAVLLPPVSARRSPLAIPRSPARKVPNRRRLRHSKQYAPPPSSGRQKGTMTAEAVLTNADEMTATPAVLLALTRSAK